MGVSLKPSNFVEGGGLLDDEDVKITESRFVMFDYGGKAQPVPALMWKLDRMDGSEPISQYWSMGKAVDWIPSDNGKELVPIGRATQLVSNSNGYLLITSVINAGFPESKLADDISVFDGMEVHVNRVAAPKREGITSQKENATILTVSKILAMPGESSKATAQKGKGKTTAAAAATKSKAKSKASHKASNDDVSALAMEFVLSLLGDAEKMAPYPDGIPKAKLAPEAFAVFPKDDPNRSAIVQLVFNDTFLNEGPWKYEGGKISAA